MTRSHAPPRPRRRDGAFGPQHGLHGAEVHIAAEIAGGIEVLMPTSTVWPGEKYWDRRRARPVAHDDVGLRVWAATSAVWGMGQRHGGVAPRASWPPDARSRGCDPEHHDLPATGMS